MGSTFQYREFIRKNLGSLSNLLNLGFIQGTNALIQLIIVYIITRRLGLDEFGHVAVATTYAALVSLLVNYGSNQSGIKDVALHRNDPQKLSEVFYTIYVSRFFICVGSILVILLLQYNFQIRYGWYFLLASTIVLSETFNPLFFFVGIQKLFLYNLMNLAGRLISAAAIILFIHEKNDGAMVNFYMGIGNTLTYGLLFAYLIKKNALRAGYLRLAALKEFIIKNFYLTGNSISVQLQQSFFLFTVSATGDAQVLGAYSICDKIVMSFRLVIISFSTAIYPRAAVSFQQQQQSWRRLKTKINKALVVLFIAGGFAIFLLAPLITKIITGSESALTSVYIRCISFVPLIAALNSMNVIELLLKDKYHYIFIIALLLLGITMLASLFFYLTGNPLLFGYYPVSVEIFSLPLYWYYMRRADGPARL